MGDKNTVVLGVRVKAIVVAAPSPVVSIVGSAASQLASTVNGSNAGSPLPPPQSGEAFGGPQHGSGTGSVSC
jgi:hypothetical protein